MKKVTVGMPVYNGENYLDRALSSLHNQTFEDVRILISDNCSTDDTPNILRKWAEKDSRFEVHTQKENLGAMGNYNYVLDAADSPWFMFAAHDDWWSENYIERLCAVSQTYSEIDFVVPSVVHMKQGADGRDFVDRTVEFNDSINNASGVGRIKMLLRHVTGSWYYGLYRREALVANLKNWRDYPHAWGQDLIMMLPFFLSGRVAGANDATFYQYITEASAIAYKPKTGSEQYMLYCDFWRSMFSQLRASSLSRGEKICLASDLYHYSKWSGKPRRIVKTYIKEFFSFKG
jgi:glycosyltransferase involved in cell wall biosynthesis